MYCSVVFGWLKRFCQTRIGALSWSSALALPCPNPPTSTCQQERRRSLGSHPDHGITDDLDNVPIVIHTRESEVEWPTTMRLKYLCVFTGLRVGTEPVLEWLRGLGRGDRRAIGTDLMRVQFGWLIGMPLVRSLKDGLWEVRSTLSSNRIARLILCFHRGTLVVLHGFIKKTRKTPAEDIALAKRRMKEVIR